MQGWFLNILLLALKFAWKLFSFSLSLRSHCRIAQSTARAQLPRTPHHHHTPLIFLLTGCLLTPSQFFQTRTRSWWNWEAILQTAQTREFLFSFTPRKKNWSNLLCVNRSEKPFHGIAFVTAGVRNPQIFSSTDLFFCKDWFNSCSRSPSQPTLPPKQGPQPVSSSGFCLF